MHVYGIKKKGTEEHICRAESETQTQTLDTAGEDRVGQIERVALKDMHYHMKNR